MISECETPGLTAAEDLVEMTIRRYERAGTLLTYLQPPAARTLAAGRREEATPVLF